MPVPGGPQGLDAMFFLNHVDDLLAATIIAGSDLVDDCLPDVRQSAFSPVAIHDK
jgi:hypothetical protein